MASEKGSQDYENVYEKEFTLTEISETVKEYPIIVKAAGKKYEIPDSEDLPDDKEMLLEKPKCLQFVLVRILDFDDEQQIITEKGEEFVEERKRFVGEEFLIPICYPGTFKLINKSDSFTSMDQVRTHLPRFIRIDQETLYTPPGQSCASTSLAAGTKLEVKSVSTVEGVRYVKCKSVKTSRTYTFKEDFPIYCTAVDDPTEYTLLSLAGRFVLLPKNAQFQNIWAGDVVFKDDDEARTLLSLTGGPVKILKTFIRRQVYIGWIEKEGTSSTTVSLISEQIWNDKLVQMKTFDDSIQTHHYIKEHFGEGLDSKFVLNGLYTMPSDGCSITLLAAPQNSMKDDEQVDYESIEKQLTDYEKLRKQTEDVSDYENMDSQREGHEGEDSDIYEVPAPAVHTVPDPPPSKEHLQVSSPASKAKNENKHVLHTITSKARLGFNKVHKEISKHITSKEVHSTDKNGKKTKKPLTPNTLDEQEPARASECDRNKEVLKDTCKQKKDEAEDTEEGTGNSDRLYRASKMDIDRPLEPLPPETSINVTDDEKLYDQVEDKAEKFQTMLTEEKKTHQKIPEMLLPERNKIGRANQSSKDFYSYTVQEVFDCLEICNLNRFAINCHENKLDGAFFRELDLNVLKSEPFNLNFIELLKVRKIIEEGWRPKL